MNRILDSFIQKIFYRWLYSRSREDIKKIDRVIHQKKLMEGSQPYPEHLHYFYWERQIDFWKSMPCPIRPSRGDLEIYRDLLGASGRKERVLILGSTPELRDLAAQRIGAKTYLADFSYRMPPAMLPFTKYVDPMKEIWVKANWFELPFPEFFFDVLLGDLVLQQFPPRLEPVFLEKMSLLLKPDGVFIVRLQFLDERLKLQNIEDIINKTIKSSLGDREQFALLRLRILWLFANPEKRLLNRDISAREFERFVNASGTNNAIIRKALASLRADEDSFRNWSPPTEEELVRIISAHFDIIDKKVADDYEDALYCPIYALRPKA